ncbi:MAG TPA: TetR/AcrR family transcriptional regulator [Jiangellaceae bacterium]
MGRRRVHDERLRERLLDAAGRRLVEHGLNGLSLRTLAADAGTSTAAVYSLFGGKPGLLAALHDRAFRRLGTAQMAVGTSDDPVEDVVRLGLAYRASAVADPHGYQIMFGGEIRPDHVGRRLLEAAAGTFLPLLTAVRRCADENHFRRDVPAESIATALWANVHGLVSLELGGVLPPQAGPPADVFEAAVRAAARGWTL